MFPWSIITSFFSSSFGFVLKYWKQIIVIGMFVLIFHQNVQTITPLTWIGIESIESITDEYEEKLGIVEEQLITCEVSREELKNQIESVNTQIDKWAAVSSQLQNSHDALTQELAALKKKSSQAVQDILAGPTPQGCQAAIQFLRDAAKEDLRWAE